MYTIKVVARKAWMGQLIRRLLAVARTNDLLSAVLGKTISSLYWVKLDQYGPAHGVGSVQRSGSTASTGANLTLTGAFDCRVD